MNNYIVERHKTKSENLLRFVSALIVLFALTPATGNAQGNLLFGQRHSYTVTFRGNGEAIVYARLIITNSGDTLLNDFNFEIPSANISDLIVVQQKQTKTCIRYQTIGNTRVCDQYSEPNFDNQFYRSGSTLSLAEYQKAKFNSPEKGKYSVTLPFPISPNESGSLIMAYAAKGYVTNRLGLYKYAFQTIKVDGRVAESRVGVDVDSDLFIRGKRAEVNYVPFADSVDQTSYTANLGLGVSTKSESLDNLSYRIGSGGLIVKTAKNLAPFENFIIRGQYATSQSRLYMNNIITTIIILSIAIAAAYLLRKHWRKRHPRIPNTPAIASKDESIKSPEDIKATMSSAALMGFVTLSSIIILSLFIRAMVKSDFIDEIMDKIYELSGVLQTVLTIIIFFVLMSVYVLAIFGPAAYVGSKRGYKGFLYTFVSALAWSLIIFMVFIVLAG